MLQVLVSNVYTYNNKGDAAIVFALLLEIKRVFDNPNIVIQTADIKNDENKYGEPVTSSLLWILLSSQRENSTFKRIFVLVCGVFSLLFYSFTHRFINTGPKVFLSRNLKDFVEANEKADLVIACGGGYLRTANSGIQNSILLLITCLNFLAPKWIGKKVFLYSQSIGPVHGGLQHKILKFALKRVDIIEAREDVSSAFVERLGFVEKLAKTADPALLLENKGIFPEDAVELQSGKLHVGVTVRKWFKTEERLEEYISTFAEAIDYLIVHHNAQVFYLPQVIAKNFGDDDRLIAERVLKKVKDKNGLTLIEKDLHPFEAIGICGKMDIFIGTRMHSNIFALVNKVPVIAIEYEHKTRGIMKGLGLESLTIDIDKMDINTISLMIDDLIRNRTKYSALIKKNLPSQIKESQIGIELIKKEYEKSQ